MKKLFLQISFIISVFMCFPRIVAAQNLYINDLNVYYAPSTSADSAYCNFSEYGSGMKKVSMLTKDGSTELDPWNYSAKIEFANPVKVDSTHSPRIGTLDGTSQNVSNTYFYPNSCLILCANVQCASSTAPIAFGVDEMTFEIFKFTSGTNPLDGTSAPPLKTISLYNLGSGRRCYFENDDDPNGSGNGNCIGNTKNTTRCPQNFGSFCAAWDGTYNLNGDFGKNNGYYGFRAMVKTSQTTSQGTSIDIQQTGAYPGQNQIPIHVDVTDIHNVISSVTAVGKATVVPARPYNFKYQLSKDATTTIQIFDADRNHNNCADAYGRASFSADCLVRTIVDHQPKVGEGNTDNPVANGDFWDGRNSYGAMVPAGSYIARLTASSNDFFGHDEAQTVDHQMTLDPLQITDFGVRPLGYSPTDYAVISYMLTEAATVVVRIYPANKTFGDTTLTGYLSDTCLTSDGTRCTKSYINTILGDDYLREFVEEKNARVTSYTQWDGRDKNGTPLCDGNYIYAVYAVMPSEGKFGNSSTYNWTGVTTKRIYTGTIPIIRGPVISSFSPSSTIIGSSPTASGLEPFYFTYLPVRDTTVNLKIFSIDKNNRTIKEIRTVVSSGTRTGGFYNRDIWDGLDNEGNFVSSGTYLAQLETTDPFNCENNRVSTRTAIIPVNLLRTVDVVTTPLLSASSAQATISYNLSETMNIDFKIYEPGVTLHPYSEGSASPNWPEGIVLPADKDRYVYSLEGIRPRRMKITEAWDGKDNNGNMVADGIYPYVLKAYSTQRDGNPNNALYSSDVTYGYITVSRGQLIFNKFRVFPTIPTTYNSSETVNLPPYGIEYSLSRQSTVTIKVVDWQDVTKVYADVVKGENREPDIQHTDYWDGKCTTSDYPNVCSRYDFIKDGSYKIMVVAEDADQLQSLRKPATAYTVMDVAPLKIFDVSISEVGPGTPGVISYQVSEPMKVVTKIYEPGTVLPNNFDEPPASIVKRMIGVKSARVQIDDIWDGTDLSMFPVDDGTYVFTIFGTTVTTAVDGITGNLSSNSIRKDYDAEWNGFPTAYTIPVSRGGSIDVCGSFENDSYFAPNPYTGKNGWFRIPVKATGSVTLKIYNLAGDLVYSKDYGKKGSDESINGKGKCNVTHTHEACWPKVNNSGQELARGVYFAVLRFESADGTKTICQTVKKILIP